MMRGFAMTLVVVAAGACTNESSSLPRPVRLSGPEAPRDDASDSRPAISARDVVKGFAVVPGGTALRVAPHDEAETLTLHETEAVAFRVIGKEPGFVELETLSPSEAAEHCVGGHLHTIRSLRLRFFARPEQLATVLRSTLTVGPPVAQKTVRAGSVVDVGRVDGDVDALGLAVSVPVEPRLVGRFYEVGAPLSGEGQRRVAEDALALPLPSTGIARANNAVVTFGHAEREGRHFVEVGNRCARLMVRSTTAPQHAYAMKGPKEANPVLARGNDPSMPPPPELFIDINAARPQAADASVHQVAAHSIVYWPDGRRAGRVGAEQAFLLGLARPQGSRTCLSFSTDDGSQLFELCFDRDDSRR